MYWYLKVLKTYAVFSGRSRRAEYWYFTLFTTLISVGLGIVYGFMWGSFELTTDETPSNPMDNVLTNIYGVATIIPSFAVAVRRLHDLDKSGWWLLLHLALGIGTVILLVWMMKSGTEGANGFGEDPKREGVEFFEQLQ